MIHSNIFLRMVVDFIITPFTFEERCETLLDYDWLEGKLLDLFYGGIAYLLGLSCDCSLRVLFLKVIWVRSILLECSPIILAFPYVYLGVYSLYFYFWSSCSFSAIFIDMNLSSLNLFLLFDFFICAYFCLFI